MALDEYAGKCRICKIACDWEDTNPDLCCVCNGNPITLCCDPCKERKKEG